MESRERQMFPSTTVHDKWSKCTQEREEDKQAREREDRERERFAALTEEEKLQGASERKAGQGIKAVSFNANCWVMRTAGNA